MYTDIEVIDWNHHHHHHHNTATNIGVDDYCGGACYVTMLSVSRLHVTGIREANDSRVRGEKVKWR
jgi:hypothetical protein